MNIANPRQHGKELTSECLGDYRILADIKEDEIVIEVLTIGYRRAIYFIL